jgi:hypothetical protein
MFDILQVVSVLLTAIAVTTALAHALELPGKMRLTRDEYFAVQRIYYPGFTLAGIGEGLAPVATAILLVLTPRDGAAFWLTLVALLGLLGMQAVYWIVTHPVNKLWLEGQQLGAVGSGFFSADPARRSGSVPTTTRAVEDWQEPRDRWEYSHVARAGLAVLSLVALVIAVS